MESVRPLDDGLSDRISELSGFVDICRVSRVEAGTLLGQGKGFPAKSENERDQNRHVPEAGGRTMMHNDAPLSLAPIPHDNAL